jgi:formate hydrogenlyase subunit 3/multisubunit Na+/H+ antiporter MnhD subunit
MIYLLLGILIIFAGSLVSAFLPERINTSAAALFTSAGAALSAFPAVKILFKGNSLPALLPLGYPFGNVRLEIDPLSALFIVIIAAGSIAASIYAIGYLKPYRGKKAPLGSHLFFLGTLCASMLLLVTVRHALFFLIVWEAMSLSSCFCVIFEHDDADTVRAGIFYAVAMHIGVAFLSAAFILLSNKTGSYDFRSFTSVLSAHNRFSGIIFALFFAGFGLKAGFVPLHTWLPKAHPAAPSHVSALMSGVMIKTGIYGIIRIVMTGGIPSTPLALSLIAAASISAVYGILNALSCRDLKKLLAYSSIENMGIIGMGVGFGMLGMSTKNEAAAFLGFAGALFHTVNHSLFKGILFQCAGSVYQQTHLRDMEKLGGLVHRMPKTAFFFMTGCAAICALPPLNGFAGELLVFLGMLDTMTVSSVSIDVAAIGTIALLGFVGAMAIIAFTKLFSITFLGQARSEAPSHAHEPSATMLIPMGIFVLISVMIGLFPQYAFRVLVSPVQAIIATSGMTGLHSEAPAILTGLSHAGLILLGIFAAVFTLRCILLRGKKVRGTTWGCGYRAGSSRIQYTAHAFVHPFVFQAGKMTGSDSNIEKPKGIFPASARFLSVSRDLIETAVVDPPVRLVGKLLGRFPEIQTGKTEIYILYGFLFLVACLVWTMIGGK